MRTVQELEGNFAPRSNLGPFKSFFLVGIGGAGMSVVARILLERGFGVRGTDRQKTKVVRDLELLGAEIVAGSMEQVNEHEALVLSDAIPLSSVPQGFPKRSLFRRSQLLGFLLCHQKVIAITGTHGKTTTTAMAGHALRAAGLDVTIVGGADLPGTHGGYRAGASEWAVVEACEAYDSLRDIDPFHVILTNLEHDHFDFHASKAGLFESVARFASRRPPAGCLFFNKRDEGAQDIARGDRGRTTPFEPTTLKLLTPGAHNRENAGAVIALCASMNLDMEKVQDALRQFQGATRRLEVVYDREITVVDDYAHHPTEIRASISALRERYPSRRIVAVFQPHLYSRTANLLPEFASALDLADQVILTDIYPAREKPLAGMSSLRIVEKLSGVPMYIPQRLLLPQKVAEVTKNGDVILAMGAGNISEFAPAFLHEWKRRSVLKCSPQTLDLAVLIGGESPEREVSLHSGQAIEAALRRLGYQPRLIDVSELLLTGGDLSSLTGANRPDAAILAVHGVGAEDGALQGLLELLHIPYNGSGIQASALTMDKDLTKRILLAAGLPVPQGVLVRQGDPLPSLELPVVVKPNAQGSTVGLSIVREIGELESAVQRALAYDVSVLVEEMIEGIEISVPVLGNKALPAVEIVPTSGSYDFESKYTPGATAEICPARLTPEQLMVAQSQALKAHVALGCKGITRTDMIVQPHRMVILEVNNLPGMTPTSLVPRSALAAGLTFEDVVQEMVNDATSKA